MTDLELTLILHEASLDPREVNYTQDPDWLEKKAKSLMIALEAILERLERSEITVTSMTYVTKIPQGTLDPKDIPTATGVYASSTKETNDR